MNQEIIVLIGAVITALISAFTVIYQARKKEPEQAATATDSIAEAARKVVELQNQQIVNMSKQIEEIEKDLKQLRKYVRLFRAGVKKLVAQVEELGIDPAWNPDDLPPIEDKE